MLLVLALVLALLQPAGDGREQFAQSLYLGGGEQHASFTLREPAGVVLLARMTVPHGTRAYVVGRIASARVAVTTEVADTCRARGGVDVCTQPIEWCPIPAATWRFRLHKLSGPAGRVRVEFRVGALPA